MAQEVQRKSGGLFHLTTGQRILGGLAIALMVLVIIGAVLSALSVVAVVVLLAVVGGMLGALALRAKGIGRTSQDRIDSRDKRRIDYTGHGGE